MRPENPEKKILIIENLETFRYFDYPAHGFCGCMYGGGQANRADKALLNLLLAAGFSLWYFGDMDPEGLQIYQFFSIFCNSKVRPWGMHESLYKKYSMYGYSLDEAKLSKLQRLEIPEFDELISCMLETGVGVEQEIISF
ncbi:MAG: DUF2399 domain-containing protein [Bacteroidales bacterium]|nr:DUF2399 domain-containing protein [Bacteroidales bacterium]